MVTRPPYDGGRRARRQREARDGDVLVATGDPLVAQHPGWCPSCPHAIRPGDLIVRWSDGKHRHTGCTPGGSK